LHDNLFVFEKSKKNQKIQKIKERDSSSHLLRPSSSHLLRHFSKKIRKIQKEKNFNHGP